MLIVLGVGTLLVALAFVQYAVSVRRLKRWAADQPFRLVDYERRAVRLGPYQWRRARDQDVFFVTLELPDGTRRTAYVRVSGFLSQLTAANPVDVSWT